MEIKALKIGDAVSWISQSGGYRTTKTGKIVRLIRESETPVQVAQDYYPYHKRMFDGLSIPKGAGGIAYFVEVKEGRRKPKLYMPYPSKLKHAED